MSVGSAGIQNDDLRLGLRPFRRRSLGLSAGQFALLACLAMIVIVFAAMWLDLIVALSSGVRLWLPRIALVGAVLGGAGLLLLRFYKLSDRRVASSIDRGDATGGQILAGLQLSTLPINPATELSRELAATAAQRAAERLQTIKPATIFGTRAARRALAMLAVAACAVALVAFCAPGIARHQLNRFMYPAADIPHYTGIEISLLPEHGSVLYGDDLRATARVTRGQAEQMTLVARRADGSEATLPMLASGEGEFSAVLVRVTEPLELYARFEESRSTRHRIEVQLTPLILPPEVTIEPPAYTGRATYRAKLFN